MKLELKPGSPLNVNAPLATIRGLLQTRLTAVSMLEIKLELSRLEPESDARIVAETFVRGHLLEQANEAHSTLNAIREMFPDLCPGSTVVFTYADEISAEQVTALEEFVERYEAGQHDEPLRCIALPDTVKVSTLTTFDARRAVTLQAAERRTYTPQTPRLAGTLRDVMVEQRHTTPAFDFDEIKRARERFLETLSPEALDYASDGFIDDIAPIGSGTTEPQTPLIQNVHMPHPTGEPDTARCGATIPEAGSVTDLFNDVDCPRCLAGKRCERCHGSGLISDFEEYGPDEVLCPVCGGSGRIYTD